MASLKEAGIWDVWFSLNSTRHPISDTAFVLESKRIVEKNKKKSFTS